jgi:transketolase
MKFNEKILKTVANVIRGLSIDAIEQANSGHPGLPLGCAEIMAYLYGYELKHNPNDPDWINRDRFILSAGHGSMALYASLHLAGFDLSIDDLKAFRQASSKTPGHPEYGHCDGVETTTGPLGQGVATAAGMALGMKILADKFSDGRASLFDSKVYVLAGDGCIMEGITSEASSLAGHLNLNNLIVIYDSNDICLDGPVDECFSENTKQRYESYGWFVQTIDGHSFKNINLAIEKAKGSKQPSLIIAKTVIGKGSPNFEGTSDVHGKALGEDEARKTKKALKLPDDHLFYVPNEVKFFFEAHAIAQKKNYLSWQEQFHQWRMKHPQAAELLESHHAPVNQNALLQALLDLDVTKNKATRVQSSQCLQLLATLVPGLIGGSADLSCSDNTFLSDFDFITAKNYSARNIKYGVREFAMAAMASGLVLTRAFRPYVGTFLMFSDYMRNAIRLSALMNIPVMYQFTHDSVFLGEDGPTHQPVEHLASLRAMPNLTVCRPADENEVKAAWFLGLTRSSPTAIVLSRQGIESLEESSVESAIRGGYVLKEHIQAKVTLFATGSECALAIAVAELLRQEGITSRVVSLMSWEVFSEQDDDYKEAVLGHSPLKVSIEAQSSFGWERYVGSNGLSISIDSFGISAPYSEVKDHFKFTKSHITRKIRDKLGVLSGVR